MLLCDAAQAVGGKLYILGAGWSQVFVPDVPTNMALALKLGVPWNEANDPHDLRLSLLTADGEVVELPNPATGEAVTIRNETRVETGRPPGLAPGTEIDAALVFDFPGLPLPAGSYVWLLEVDGHPEARIPFRVGPVERRA